MASLKKRGDTYYVQYYENGRQKRKNLHTSSLQVAKAELGKIESDLLDFAEIRLPTRTPLDTFLEKYIKYLGAHSKNTSNVQKETSRLRGIFGQACDSLKIKNQKIAEKAAKRPSGPVPRIEIKYLENLTPELASSFLTDLKNNKGLDPKTVNNYRQTLITMCNYAIREGGVRFPGKANPAEPVKRFTESTKSISFLRLDDIDKQLKALAGETVLQTMVAMYIYAGLRRAEGLWLTPEDIEWTWGHHGAILVRAKEGDEEGEEDWETKTRKDRIVPLSRKLREYLDRYVAICGLSGPWLFHAPEGGRWDPDNFSTFLRKTNSLHELEWTCLDYRHTFGSQLAMKGESLYKISKIMGNSEAICQKHYAALLPESLMESVDFPEDSGKKGPDKKASEGTLPDKERPRLKLVVNNR